MTFEPEVEKKKNIIFLKFMEHIGFWPSNIFLESVLIEILKIHLLYFSDIFLLAFYTLICLDF